MPFLRILAVFLATCAAISFAPEGSAQVRMPKIFGDGMVLQRQKPVKIWGVSIPGSKVEVSFGGRTKAAIAGADGRWSLYLDAMEASSKPAEMLVSQNGKNALKFSDVLVGEVWIAAGQCNMEMPLADSAEYKKSADEYASEAIRIIKIGGAADSPQADIKTPRAWSKAGRETAEYSSAAGMNFAVALKKAMKVPVGLIQLSDDSAATGAWIPKAELAKGDDSAQTPTAAPRAAHSAAGANAKTSAAKANPKASPASANAAQPNADARQSAQKIAQKTEGQNSAEQGQNSKNAKQKAPEARKANKATLSALYNARVAPIAGYAARGAVIWFGEADAMELKHAEAFEAAYPALISSWRKAWGDESLFFVCAQLSGFENKFDWPSARWKQFLACESLPNASIVNTIDLGERENIRPKRKAEAGERLANSALKKLYGRKEAKGSYPKPSLVSYKEDGAEIQFRLDGKKLAGRGAPRGFEVKIGDSWKKARAEIRGNIVFVRPPAADEKISGVRYLWSNWCGADIWLFNEDGLPAFPFINER